MENCDAESISRSLCSSSNNSANFKHEMLGVFLLFRHVGIEHLLNDVSCYVLAGVAFMLGDEGLRLVFDVLSPWLDRKTSKKVTTDIKEVQHGESRRVGKRNKPTRHGLEQLQDKAEMAMPRCYLSECSSHAVIAGCEFGVTKEVV